MGSVAWDKYHIGVGGPHHSIFIGRGEPDLKKGKIKWTSASGDRSEEIIKAVMEKMQRIIKKKDDPNKPYHAYHQPGVGTLVFIQEGFDFAIRPAPRK